jgi:hypothetical protein
MRITGKIMTVADAGASAFLLLRRVRRVSGNPMTDPMLLSPAGPDWTRPIYHRYRGFSVIQG